MSFPSFWLRVDLAVCDWFANGSVLHICESFTFYQERLLVSVRRLRYFSLVCYSTGKIDSDIFDLVSVAIVFWSVK